MNRLSFDRQRPQRSPKKTEDDILNPFPVFVFYAFFRGEWQLEDGRPRTIDVAWFENIDAGPGTSYVRELVSRLDAFKAELGGQQEE